MSGNRFKKMRQYVRGLAPADIPAVDYALLNEHQKKFTFPAGTHIPAAPDIVPVIMPTAPGTVPGTALSTVAMVTVRQVVLDRCVRRVYKRLKRDVLRSIRNIPPVNWEKQDQMNVARVTK